MLLFCAQCRYTEIAQRIHSEIQYTSLTPDKLLNSLIYTLCLKIRTPKTDWHNFVKIRPLWMIFHIMHRHLIADWLRLKSLMFNANCTVSMATTAPCRSAQHATWLNWSSDWLRSRLTANWPSLIRPLTSGENDSRPVSRLRDSILNSCCNLYFHLSFVVYINSQFLMIEKSRCNHVNCNDCMAHQFQCCCDNVMYVL